MLHRMKSTYGWDIHPGTCKTCSYDVVIEVAAYVHGYICLYEYIICLYHDACMSMYVCKMTYSHSVAAHAHEYMHEKSSAAKKKGGAHPGQAVSGFWPSSTG